MKSATTCIDHPTARDSMGRPIRVDVTAWEDGSVMLVRRDSGMPVTAMSVEIVVPALAWPVLDGKACKLVAEEPAPARAAREAHQRATPAPTMEQAWAQAEAEDARIAAARDRDAARNAATAKAANDARVKFDAGKP